MKYLVTVLVWVLLTSCGAGGTSEGSKSDPDTLYRPEEMTIFEFLGNIQYGDGLDLSNCEFGTMNNGVINSPSKMGPISCLIVIEPFQSGDVMNLAETLTVNGGLPAVVIHQIELPKSYWKRVLLHESIHAKRLPTLSKDCRLAYDCMLDEEVLAYGLQFKELETYWRGLGWDGGEAPSYPEGDSVTLVALNTEKVLWQYYQAGRLKEYLYSLGYNQ